MLYLFARALIALIQSLPLPVVAWIGRRGGALAYWLDARHRRVTLQNLEHCFRKGEIGEGNPRHRQGEFPAHWRELLLRDQNRRDERRGIAAPRRIYRVGTFDAAAADGDGHRPFREF